MSDTTVAKLRVVIGADISDLQSGLDKAKNSVNGFANVGNSIKGVGDKMTDVARKAGMLALPIAGAFGWGIKVASDFEGAMAEIEARTGSTSAEMANISAFALQMGADTSFSGQQAAEALLQIMTSGSSAEEAMALLPSVMDAAAASGEDLGQTADTITDIVAAFNLDPIDESRNVVDALAQASGASSATMAELGQGFANVGGVARSFGMGVEETAATLAVFSENGIKGAEAGTALKSLLLNMSRDTNETQGAWKRLGVSMYDANGDVRDMEQVIGELDASLDQLPVEEQNRLMMDLAGSYGIVGLTALRGSISMGEMEARMGGQATASDVAAARMDTFAGRMDSLKGSVESLMITALTPFMDNVLTPLATKATEIVNDITDWVEKNPELASSIIGIGAGALVAIPLIAGLGFAISGIGVVVGLVTSPIFLLIGLIAGVATALFSIPEVQAGLQAWGEAFQTMGQIAATVWPQIVHGFEMMKAQISVQLADFLMELRGSAIGGFIPGLSSISVEDLAQSKAEAIARVDELKFGEAVRDAIVGQVKGTDVDLSTMVSFTMSNGSIISNSLEGLMTGGTEIDWQNLIDSLGVNAQPLMQGLWDKLSTEGDYEAMRVALPFIAEVEGVDMTMTGETLNGFVLDAINAGDMGMMTFVTRFYPEFEMSEDEREKARVSMNSKIQNAIQYGSAEEVQVLADLAVELGLDTGQMVTDFDGKMKYVPWSAYVQAKIMVDPLIGFLTDPASAIQNAIAGVQTGFSNLMGSVMPGFDLMGKFNSAVDTLGGGSINGSHADGLDYVPFDGYIAKLHKGERVLTADQNRAMSASGRGGNRGEAGGGGGTVIKNYYVNSYGESPHKLVELIRKHERKGAR